MENVFPGEFGVPKPFYFFLKKSYWLGDPDEAEIEDLEVCELAKHNDCSII